MPSQFAKGSHLHSRTGMAVLSTSPEERDRGVPAGPRSSCHESALNEFPVASGQPTEGPELRLSYHK